MKVDCHCHILPGLDDGAQTLEGMYGEAVCVRAEALDAEDMYEWVGTDLHKKKYADFFDEHVLGKQ